MNPSQTLMSSAKYRLLQSLDRAQVPAAIPQFTAPVANIFRSDNRPNSDYAGPVEGELWETWTALLSVAADTPHSGEDSKRQDALVDLLMGVQSLGPLTREDGTQCKVWDMSVWDDLPVFGATVREEFNFDPADSDNPPESRSRWPNLNAFLARVTNAFFSKSPSASISRTGSPLDLSLLGLWTLRDYLESPLSSSSPSSGSPSFSTRPAATNPSSQVALHGASVWMSYAAPTLRRMSIEEKTFAGNRGNPGDAARDRNWKGYSLDRWAYWKEKFWAARNSMERSTGDEEVKRALDEAVERMEEAERS